MTGACTQTPEVGELLVEQRDALNILEARIADQDEDIGALRRRVAELEHRCTSNQAAHNALAGAVEQQDQHLRDLYDKLQEVAVELRSRLQESEQRIAYLLDRDRHLTQRLNCANIGYD